MIAAAPTTRITLAGVRHAYDVCHPLVFFAAEYWDDGKCCPLAAMYLAHCRGAVEGGDADAWARATFGDEYVEGFWFAIQGHEHWAGQGERWDEGFEDGTRVFAALGHKAT